LQGVVQELVKQVELDEEEKKLDCSLEVSKITKYQTKPFIALSDELPEPRYIEYVPLSE
jgi:hypothetical protein